MNNQELGDAIRDRKQSYLNGLKLFVKYRFVNDKAKQEMLFNYVENFEIQSTPFENAKVAEEDFYAFFRKIIEYVSVITDLSVDEVYSNLLLAEHFSVWDLGRSDLSKPTGLIDRDGAEIVQTDAPFSCLTENQKEEYLSIKQKGREPLWFRSLPKLQQIYLINKLKDATKDNIDRIILTIPSTLRSVPGLANLGEHNESRYRFAVPVPIDVKDEIERIRLTVQNIEQLFESPKSPLARVTKRFVETWGIEPTTQEEPIEVPVLLQTLLSPMFEESTIVKDLENALSKVEDKVYQIEIDGKFYFVKPKIIYQNHPVNFARRVMNILRWLKRERKRKNEEASDKLLKSSLDFLSLILQVSEEDIIRMQAQFITSFDRNNIINLKRLIDEKVDDEQQKKELNILCDALIDYIGLFQRAPSLLTRLKHLFVRGAHKELFMESLEEIITTKIGGLSSGSCKSGKDRKGMETLHTDAMLAYYKKYGKFPKYEDTKENRRNFIDVFVKFFESKQAHMWAAFNSPGAFGIKGIQTFSGFRCIFDSLPSNILNKVFQKREDVRRNILLANLNKPKKPFTRIKKKKKSEIIKEFKANIRGSLDKKEMVTTISKPTYKSADSFGRVVEWVAPEDVKVEDKVKVLYFPNGCIDSKYDSNTLEIKGSVEAQVRNAWWCAVRYLEENPDIEKGILLNGPPKMVSALQNIFVEALGVPRDKIIFNDLIEGIVINTREFREEIEKARNFKRSRQKELSEKEREEVLLSPENSVEDTEEVPLKKTR